MLYDCYLRGSSKLCFRFSMQRDTTEPDVYAAQAHKLVDFVIESAIKKLEFQLEEREKTLESIKLDLSR